MTQRFTAAVPADLPSITALPKENHLPFEDVGAHLPDFLLYKKENVLAGCVAFENLKPYALLRSLAVAYSSRNAGIGMALVQELLSRAGALEITDIYLLTTSAEKYFVRLGFEKTGRDSLPQPIRGTKEFTGLCPSSATALYKNINTH